MDMPQGQPTGEALQARIIRACGLCEDRGGIPQSELEAVLSMAQDAPSKEALMQALNGLIQSGRLVVCTSHDGGLVFRLQSDEDAAKLHGLSSEDRLVYQEIEKSGSDGMLSKDLRVRTGVRAPQLTKVLKTLETRRLVQRVKSIKAKNQILYMLANIEPSLEVTGGAWYGEQRDFDHELVKQLQDVAMRFVASRLEGVTAKQVHDFMVQQKVLNFELTLDDMRAILQTLVYDARLEQHVRDASGEVNLEAARYVRAVMEPPVPQLTSVPCVVCPCAEDALHDAATCPHLTTWLDHAVQLPW